MADSVVAATIQTGGDIATGARISIVAIADSVEALAFVVTVILTGGLVTLQAYPAFVTLAIVGIQIAGAVSTAKYFVFAARTNFGLAQVSTPPHFATAVSFCTTLPVIIAFIFT